MEKSSTDSINQKSYLRLMQPVFRLFDDFILVYTSPTHSIQWINETAKNYHGWKDQEIRNKNYYKLCQKDSVCPVVIESLAQLGEDKKPLIRFEETNNHVPIKWIVTYLWDHKKAPIGILILGQKLFEKQLKRLQSSLDIIVDSIPGSVYWKDRTGIYLGCNKTMVNKSNVTSKSDVIGKTDHELWPDQAEKLQRTDKEVILTDKIIETEESVKISTGECLHFASIKAPLKDDQGQIIGIVGNSLDISELVGAKKAAEFSDKAKTRFLENMRHDVRTPLSGIIGFSDIIKDATDNPKIHEYADNLKASGQSLMDFLTEILDMIKFSSGELPLLKKNFNLKIELMKVLALYQPKAKEKRLKITLDYDDRIPKCLIGDPKRVHRIALELVSNAVSFTSKGSITIKAILAKSEDRNKVIKLMVQDTGIGIPADKQQEIFVRFNRLTPSYEGIYKGAGLGLALVKQFVDELEGELYVESKEDQGSSFVCVLPFREALLDEAELHSEEEIALTQVSLPAPKSKSRTEAPTAVRESNILLVEDNAFAMQIAQSMLTALGCKVDVAPDGKTAIQLFQDNPYDLIFMDIGLPDLDGYEVTRRIRLLERYRDRQVPIIALSAHADTDHKKRCIETGMNAVLLKPLSTEQANDILNAFIPERGIAAHGTDVAPSPQKTSWLAPITAKCYDDTYIKKELKFAGEKLKEFLGIWIESLGEDLPQFKAAYTQSNYVQLQKLAHKMKGGAMYCGAARFQEACRRLEIYLDGEDRDLVPALYNLVVQESKETEKRIKEITQES